MVTADRSGGEAGAGVQDELEVLFPGALKPSRGTQRPRAKVQGEAELGMENPGRPWRHS